MAKSISEGPEYVASIRALLQMHRLALDGQFESAAADAIRDAMDAPWEKLSESEQQRLRGLSEDLNALEEAPAITTTNHANQSLVQEKLNQVHQAYAHGDWDLALELIRRLHGLASTTLLSDLRGKIWRAAGHEEVAAVFFEHASRPEPAESALRTR